MQMREHSPPVSRQQLKLPCRKTANHSQWNFSFCVGVISISSASFKSLTSVSVRLPGILERFGVFETLRGLAFALLEVGLAFWSLLLDVLRLQNEQ